MPEGDTIFRAARTLDRALKGQVVTRFETQLAALARVDEDAPLAGRTVEGVDAAGKWMRIYFSGDLILLTHMLMSGSWHIYRPGEAWKRPRVQMRAVIHTAPFVAVAFQVPIAEFLNAAALERHRSVQRLGPDVLSEEFDEGAGAARLLAQRDALVGEALLRQSVVAGIGNVFKSEVCFAAGVHPFRSVDSLRESEAVRLMSEARRLLRMNVTENSRDGIVTYTGMRRTTGRSQDSGRLWVYQRRGEPCLRCGTIVDGRKQGEDARSTFWCPRCQPLEVPA